MVVKKKLKLKPDNRKFEVRMKEALSNWRELNKRINNFSFDELEIMLKHELDHRDRTTFVKRIHARITRERSTTEKKDMGF